MGNDQPADAGTLSFYDENATTYANSVHEADGLPHLERFAAALPPGGAVLDYGCGEGWAARLFAERGFDVLGMDASAGLLKLAAAHPGLRLRRGVFEDLDDVAAYDGVWASFSLLHAPRAAMPGHLARIARALRPNGALYLGLKEGTGERRDTLGRRYAYFEAEEIAAHLADAGFEQPHVLREPGTGMTGDCTHYLHFQTRRAD